MMLKIRMMLATCLCFKNVRQLYLDFQKHYTTLTKPYHLYQATLCSFRHKMGYV